LLADLSNHGKDVRPVLPLSTSESFHKEDESDFGRNELNFEEGELLRRPMTRTPKRSAGLIMYRLLERKLEVFLVHPGGPYWAKKDQGAWTLPKGEYLQGEDALTAAQREFSEETGFAAQGPFLQLGSITQASGKVVEAWAFEGDCDPSQLISNTCLIEWPPRSGRSLEIPEVDRGHWFPIEEALENIRKEQRELLVRLSVLVKAEDD
jgi:predicted NUDIX family NTP pyrophosphohydrolase